MKKIVVGMSGGVDSSMSLVLLKQQGWQPVGVSLKLAVWEDEQNALRENVCCTDESLAIAKSVCNSLDIPHHIYDVQEEFQREVIDYFIAEHKANRTPNPCVMCNPRLKFAKLFEFARKHGIDHIATGHYARIRLDKDSNTYQLLRGIDHSKDQSYGLSYLPQKWFSKIVFPLGDMKKEDVFQLAKKHGFDTFLKRKESQDLCFVSSKALNRFLEKKVGISPGDIVDSEGKKVGSHKGLHFYTIGQSKGIGSHIKYHVMDYNIGKNQLIVTPDDTLLQTRNVALGQMHYLSGSAPTEPFAVEAKVRYSSSLGKAILTPAGGRNDSTATISFEQPQSAVTPGQFCVFYQKEVCLGAGIIRSALKSSIQALHSEQ